MTPRFPLWLMLGVPAAAALALYWPALHTGFLGDDFGPERPRPSNPVRNARIATPDGGRCASNQRR